MYMHSVQSYTIEEWSLWNRRIFGILQTSQAAGKMDASSHPVDTGWSWVILLGCTINMTLAVGTIKAFGIYFVEFLSVYEASVSITSLISGILQATYSLMALPIMTFGLKHISVRQSVFIGGCFMSLAYLLGSFAPSVEFLLFSNGFLYGLGFGMIHGPTTFLISLYFEKRRNLANAILVSGGSLGGLFFPPIYRFLLDKLELRGALLITSGILLQSVVGASLLRPIGFYKSKHESADKKNSQFDSIDDKFRERSMTEPVNRDVTSLQLKQSLLEKSKRSNSHYFDHLNGKDSHLSGHIDSSSSRILDRISQSNTVRFTSEADVYTSSLSAFGSKSIDKKENDKSTSIINLKLLKNPLMILIMISFSFGTLGGAYGGVFIAPFAKDSGTDDQAVSLVISTINGCDFAGRFIAGMLSDRKLAKSHVLVAICLIICSINMYLSFLCKELWSIILFSAIHGLLAGSLVALSPAIIIDFLGLENYRTAMGLTLLFQGLVMSSGIPVIGVIRDYTGTYLSSFQFIGSCFLVSSISLFLEPCFRDYRTNDKENNNEIIIDCEKNLIKPVKKL